MPVTWSDIFPVVTDLKNMAMRYDARGDATRIPATGVVFSLVNGEPAVQRLYLTDSIDGIQDLERFSSMIRAVADSVSAVAAGFMVVMPSIIYEGDEAVLLDEIAAAGGFRYHPSARHCVIIHMEHQREGFREWFADIQNNRVSEFEHSEQRSYSEFPTLLPLEVTVNEVGQA